MFSQLSKLHEQTPNPKSLIKSLYDSPALISRLTRTEVLDSHTGCVNALSWSESGELLASSGDDTIVCVWRPFEEVLDKEKLFLKFSTGHRANVFSIKFIPSTCDTQIATCSGDSEVRVFNIEYQRKTGSGIRRYTCHTDRAKRLATEPNNPNLLISCSEDGTVRQFDLRLDPTTTTFASSLLIQRQFELTALSLNQITPNYLAIAGSSPFIYLYDRRMLNNSTIFPSPPPIARFRPSCVSADKETDESSARRRIARVTRDHNSVTAVKFSDFNRHELLGSFSNGYVYLFNINTAISGDGVDSGCHASDNSVEATESRSATAGISNTREAKKLRKHKSIKNGQFSSDHSIVEAIAVPSTSSSPQSDSVPLQLISVSEDTLEQTEQSQCNKKRPRSASSLNDLIEPGSQEVTESNNGEADPESWEDIDSDEEQKQEKSPLEEIDTESSESDSESDSEKEEQKAPIIIETYGPFQGHCNVETVKDVNFFGLKSSYVVSGSDDGNVFVWDKVTGLILNILEGDSSVTNVIEPHPFQPSFACSGIDSTVKIFTPTHPSDASIKNEFSLLDRQDQVVSENENRRKRGIGSIMLSSRVLMALLGQGGLESGVFGVGSGGGVTIVGGAQGSGEASGDGQGENGSDDDGEIEGECSVM